jgi:hypothetical protein
MAAGSGWTAAADLTIARTTVAQASGYSATGANWVGLFTNQGTAASKTPSAEWTSASDGTYARQAMGASGAGWTMGAYVSATGVAFNNLNQIQFPGVTLNAQNLFCVGFFDALTSGNCQLFADLAASVPVGLTIQVQFNATTDIIFTIY